MKSPDILFGELFRDVQLGRIFNDSKTFVDCLPKASPESILAQYQNEKQQPDFDLEQFVRAHFDLPTRAASDYVSDTTLSTTEHINRLWDRLTRPADTPVTGSSRVPLPHPYVVPGGRFREIFYWDSYFTMLGLKEAGRVDLIEGMVDNFAYLIEQFGFIPNGNRTYFLSRSQPPFFALMVNLLIETKKNSGSTFDYARSLRQEYTFWMTGTTELNEQTPAYRRVVTVGGNRLLNRYWDDTPTPRPEAYRQEVELTPEAEALGVAPDVVYNHIRAACESGWDFSSRWFAEPYALATTRTADIVPVDLNCLLYSLETTLHSTWLQIDGAEMSQPYLDAAIARREHILSTCWNDETGFFHDYDFRKQQQTPALTLAGVFPLFFNLATPEQAARIHDRLKADFLQAGGWVTTLVSSGQQWDWPNGWAPLQWIVYKGLLNYGFTETAHEGRDRWLALNDKVFKATGKMMEKYNVVDAALTTGGGEYPNQDGFGWTNGVYLAMKG